MSPKELSTALRRIASKIDASNAPSRNLVLDDIRRIMASFNEPEVTDPNDVLGTLNVRRMMPILSGGDLFLAFGGGREPFEAIFNGSWEMCPHPFESDRADNVVCITVGNEKCWYNESTDKWQPMPR